MIHFQGNGYKRAHPSGNRDVTGGRKFSSKDVVFPGNDLGGASK
jgi:hypothetical protein